MDAFVSEECRRYAGRGDAALVRESGRVSIFWQPSQAKAGSWIRLGSLEPPHAWSRFEGIAELDGVPWTQRTGA
jgi:hypothetical protein